MTRMMLILSAIAALMLISAPAVLACENCGCKQAKADQGAKAKAKDCPADCDCAACKAKKAKKDKACGPDCDCAACKDKKAKKAKKDKGCDCGHKGSHPECPHAKAHKSK